jgi:hypothetical protein
MAFMRRTCSTVLAFGVGWGADGFSLFTTSEGAGVPLYEIQVLNNRILPR